MKIKNREKLLRSGDIKAKEIVLDIMEASLHALDAYQVISSCMSLDGDILQIGNHRWNLGLKRRIFVIGAGKACNSMAEAVEERLGDRISEGLVIVKKIEPGHRMQRIELAEGGHPLPNKESLSASRRILSMIDQAMPDDLFICVISGGSSALMACPVPGITLEDEIEVTDRLIKSGARILEINAVRRHISATNGGRLAQKIEEKGAEMINLIVSDLVEDAPKAEPGKTADFFGTPAAPDTTTFKDAREALRKYDLWPLRTPRSIVNFLKNDVPAMETPKIFGSRIHQFVLERPPDACEAAKRASEKMGITGFILTTMLEGESREAGTFLASVAKEIRFNLRPVPPPCIMIAGGETTTRIHKTSGLGGPSQELALGFALDIANLAGCSIAALDTDGTDGPTEIAGGIADSTTVERAAMNGIDLYERLKAHDSSNVLQALGDEIITGNTGTNVCDLNVVYIS